MLYLAYKSLKEVEWVGNSKTDLMEFPREVRREIGYALYVAQKGETHESAKLFKGFGSGIYEIVNNHNKNAYRAIYMLVLMILYVCFMHSKKNQKKVLKHLRKN